MSGPQHTHTKKKKKKRKKQQLSRSAYTWVLFSIPPAKKKKKKKKKKKIFNRICWNQTVKTLIRRRILSGSALFAYVPQKDA